MPYRLRFYERWTAWQPQAVLLAASRYMPEPVAFLSSVRRGFFEPAAHRHQAYPTIQPDEKTVFTDLVQPVLGTFL